MRLLVFDPGETTGWAFFEDGKIRGGSFHMWDAILKLMDAYKPTTILYESFHLNQSAATRLIGSDFPACQVIGVLKYLTARATIPLESQNPAMRSSIKLERIPGFNLHARDAAKHGMRYLIRKGLGASYARYRRRNHSSTSKKK